MAISQVRSCHSQDIYHVNKNLEEQVSAIFKALFVDFDLSTNNSYKDWKETTIDELTLLVSRGITPKYDDTSDQIVINQKCIRNHMIDIEQARAHLPKAINEKWLQYGDLLLNSTGTGTLGRAAQVWFDPVNITVDTHVMIVRPAKPELIYYIGFWGLQHEKEIEALHTGSTGQTELPRDRVKSMNILLPDSETLSQFNQIAKAMTEQIIINQDENKKLSILRDTLLPKLMSGELDVSDISI